MKHEREENSFFEDLERALSKENLSRIAENLKSEDGYDLKYKLHEYFMQLMARYEIPYEYAEAYTMKIISVILEQLRTVDSTKYEHYFLQEWRDEQEKSFLELRQRIEKISKELTIYSHNNMAISSSGQIDIELRRSTENPSLGIKFFIVDDENFQNEFEKQRYNELVYIRGRSREETIYCILNEFWRLDDRRPIYVVKSLESWNKLQNLKDEGNIYIPWFCADEIIAIERNTNIFVVDEDIPAFNKNVLELRPRTRNTLLRCLEEAGMEYEKAYALVVDTHGLYIQMKKQLLRGEFQKRPSWIDGISDRAKKTCLLIGKWEEIEGDKLIIESLYGNSYDRFLEEIFPYTKGEDPFLFVIKHNNCISYSLSSVDNVWMYLNVLPNEQIWQLFIEVVLEVINESENLFTYNNRERLLAQFHGESLFWSETIRKGMLKTLLIKGAYQKDRETQLALDELVREVFDCVKTEKQWIYISRFWQELCEISPVAILEKLEKEWGEDTGLLSIFKNQSDDFLFERNAYVDILWGIEQFLVQKKYFWPSFRWLLKMDSQNFEYKSNSPKDIFSRIFCTWMNFSVLQTAEEKITAAEISFELNYYNTWEYLYAAIENKEPMFGELLSPKYREHEASQSATVEEMHKAYQGYFKLLLKHMDFSATHWEKMIDISSDFSRKLRRDMFEKLLYESSQMSDEEVMQIKNKIRRVIYRHRYFASSDWSISEEELAEYEDILKNIHVNIPEYEYTYLFIDSGNCALLHPVTYDKERSREENEKATQTLIREKLIEFQEHGYRIAVLAQACALETHSSLGTYMAKFWNDGEWDFLSFKTLLAVQKSGSMAMDYLWGVSGSNNIHYHAIIDELSQSDCSAKILAEVYRVEAFRAQEIPLVAVASEITKKEFWKSSVFCEQCNVSWVLTECKKYASLDVFLDQIHQIHCRNPLSAKQIFQCFDNIESMPHSNCNQMTSYHVVQLLRIIQDAYIDDTEKCNRISQLEIFFINLLDWENMNCFHRSIKQSPELFAQLVAGRFKKDHGEIQDELNNQTYIYIMYMIYEKAHFCPTEKDGEVQEEQLEQWIEKYRQLLKENDQESLFSTTLGRLFSFSPLGKDGHEPCEAIRKMIEKYGDDKMIAGYQTEIFNQRGMFTPSAGKEELEIAKKFMTNAQYLEPLYPMTAKIFYGLYETYKRDSDRERMIAENGWD